MLISFFKNLMHYSFSCTYRRIGKNHIELLLFIQCAEHIAFHYRNIPDSIVLGIFTRKFYRTTININHRNLPFGG
ncbi:hypothetical protein D3C71_1745610 [compost metagenome]